jgi:hypothetical protein
MPLWAREVSARSELTRRRRRNSQLYFCTRFGTTFLVALLAIGAQAQRQSTVVQLLNNSSTTGRVVPSPNDLIGAAAHKWLYCTSAGSLQVIAEESPDGVSGHYVAVSPIYGIPGFTINGNPCAEIQVGGLAAYPAFNVLSISGGTISVWYLGTTGAISTFPPAVNSLGATSPTICDSTVSVAVGNNSTVQLLAGKSNQTIYLCDAQYSFLGATTSGSLQLITGGGLTCGTGPTNVWTDETTANTPQTYQLFSGTGASPRIGPGNNLCLASLTVGTGVMVSLSYAQY